MLWEIELPVLLNNYTSIGLSALGAKNGRSEASGAAQCTGVEDSGFTGQLRSANVCKCRIMKHR